jgi:hypothetical protein
MLHAGVEIADKLGADIDDREWVDAGYRTKRSYHERIISRGSATRGPELKSARPLQPSAQFGLFVVATAPPGRFGDGPPENVNR